MKKLWIMVIFMTTGLLFAEISNQEEYKAETLKAEMSIGTTEMGFVIIGDELSNYVFSLDSRSTEKFRSIISAYKELDDLAEITNYRTLHPPSMRADDGKMMQFVYYHTKKDDYSSLSVTIDMDNNGTYIEPFVFMATVDQWLYVLELIDNGFTYMDAVKTEILKLRVLENDINTL